MKALVTLAALIVTVGLGLAEEILQNKELTISGQLDIQDFKDANGHPISVWVIRLPQPVDIAAAVDDPVNPNPIKNLEVAQLACFEPKHLAVFAKYRGRSIRVSGTFFAANTQHHFTRALFCLSQATRNNLK